VGRKAEQVDRQGVKRHREMAHHLHRIDVQQHSCGAAAATDGLDRLNGAHLALPPDQRHQPGGGRQQSFEGLQIHQAVVIHRQPLHLPAPLLQLTGSGHRGRMLDG
jgi:hypothetical protein